MSTACPACPAGTAGTAHTARTACTAHTACTACAAAADSTIGCQMLLLSSEPPCAPNCPARAGPAHPRAGWWSSPQPPTTLPPQQGAPCPLKRSASATRRATSPGWRTAGWVEGAGPLATALACVAVLLRLQSLHACPCPMVPSKLPSIFARTCYYYHIFSPTHHHTPSHAVPCCSPSSPISCSQGSCRRGWTQPRRRAWQARATWQRWPATREASQTPSERSHFDAWDDGPLWQLLSHCFTHDVDVLLLALRPPSPPPRHVFQPWGCMLAGRALGWEHGEHTPHDPFIPPSLALRLCSRPGCRATWACPGPSRQCCCPWCAPS